VEVERTRSITQAADNLFMAQPNLSKAIKELEDTLGLTIFERTSKGVVPTQKGAEFLIYAKSILEQLDKVERLYKPENDEKQSFKVSIPRGSYIAKGFAKFAAELDMEKEMDINVQETNSMQAINNITDEHFDLGVIRYQTVYENYFLDFLEEKKLSFEPLWEFEYLALMSIAHPLAVAQKVQYSDMMQYVEIVHGDTFVPYLPPAKIIKNEAKKRICVYERCSQFELLSNIPRTFMWVSPVPEDLLIRYELVQRKCASDIKFKDLLIYPRGYQFTTLDKKFIDKLFAAKNEVAFKQYN
jgi:hypothetical protein